MKAEFDALKKIERLSRRLIERSVAEPGDNFDGPITINDEDHEALCEALDIYRKLCLNHVAKARPFRDSVVVIREITIEVEVEVAIEWEYDDDGCGSPSRSGNGMTGCRGRYPTATDARLYDPFGAVDALSDAIGDEIDAINEAALDKVRS